MTSIESFVASLATLPSTETAFNPWSAPTDPDAIRRTNLSLYLNELLSRRTTVLLLGEAPGYQGCRLTGLPFTSEHILINGVPSLDMYGEAKGYRLSRATDRLKKEPSGTIVWQTLARFDLLPLLWPAFPFHPHKPGNPQSNRPPTTKEVVFGRPIWQQIVAIMGIEEIVAVGNVAHRSLAAVGIDAVKIRHPSQGGKNDFVEGVRRLVLDRAARLPDADTELVTQ